MKKIIALLVAAALVFSAQEVSAKVKNQEVTFLTSIECANCAKKVTENISFEKGVKDLDVNVAKGTVKIVYNPEKTNEAALKKAIEKLGYTAEKI